MKLLPLMLLMLLCVTGAVLLIFVVPSFIAYSMVIFPYFSTHEKVLGIIGSVASLVTGLAILLLLVPYIWRKVP